MSMDTEFITAAREYFNPYVLSSGTELVAPLLYWITRMSRPRTVVEYGSGYTTLFILRALADNISETALEERNLSEKTHSTGILSHWIAENNEPPADSKVAADSGLVWLESNVMRQWLSSGGVACDVDPVFYLRKYMPHLFSFEALSENHEYVQRMRNAVHAIGHQALFTHICGQSPRRDAIPRDAIPIDLAWNDADNYAEFFSEFWESLNPSGGIMIYHNVNGCAENYEAVRSIVERRAPHGDLECLILEEPHKLNQNGCAILRRTTNYKPRFPMSRTGEVFHALQSLASRGD